MPVWILFVHLFMLFLVACVEVREGQPQSTPVLITVAYSPAAGKLERALLACQDALPELALDLYEAPAPSPDITRFQLFFRLGSPEGWAHFAAPVAEENILVVLHSENPISRLTVEELQGLFSGQIKRWDQLGGPAQPVQSWIYPLGDDTRQAFDAALWESLETSDRLYRDAYLAPGPKEMVEALEADPHAVGYLPSSWLSDALKEVEIDPQLWNALKQPVLALGAVDPEGHTRLLIGCLQSGAGNTMIREDYPKWTSTPSH